MDFHMEWEMGDEDKGPWSDLNKGCCSNTASVLNPSATNGQKAGYTLDSNSGFQLPVGGFSLLD